MIHDQAEFVRDKVEIHHAAVSWFWLVTLLLAALLILFGISWLFFSSSAPSLETCASVPEFTERWKMNSSVNSSYINWPHRDGHRKLWSKTRGCSLAEQTLELLKWWLKWWLFFFSWSARKREQLNQTEVICQVSSHVGDKTQQSDLSALCRELDGCYLFPRDGRADHSE